MKRWIPLLLIILYCLTRMVWAANVTNIRVQSFPAKTQLVFDLTGPVKYKRFSLSQPDRVIVDFFNSNLKFKLSRLAHDSKVIKKVRGAVDEQGRLRVVFDLKSKQSSRASLLKPKGAFGYRLLLTLQQAKPKKILPVKKNPKPLVTLHRRKQLRDIIVIIDPGHGGKDPGAVGHKGTREKTVVLAIAKELKRLIDRQAGMKAVLTRRGDYYISLRRRLALARKGDGDIFISIHADAYKDGRSNGVSIFALSQKGATSEAARWLAEKENYSELGGVNLDGLDDQSGLVRSVLIDLSQTATIGASLLLGEKVLGYMDAIATLHRRAVEQARFVVLKSPDIPSILIETGFISNRREEKNLASSAYRKRLAKAILRGLKRYFWDHPPEGTYVKQQVTAKVHRVAVGDNLSSVANYYHVSQASLKRINHLKSSTLPLGKVLKLPKRRYIG